MTATQNQHAALAAENRRGKNVGPRGHVVDLAFCTASLATDKFLLDLTPAVLGRLAVVKLVFSVQPSALAASDHGHLWNSRPGKWLVISSVVEVALGMVQLPAFRRFAPTSLRGISRYRRRRACATLRTIDDPFC